MSRYGNVSVGAMCWFGVVALVAGSCTGDDGIAADNSDAGPRQADNSRENSRESSDDNPINDSGFDRTDIGPSGDGPGPGPAGDGDDCGEYGLIEMALDEHRAVKPLVDLASRYVRDLHAEGDRRFVFMPDGLEELVDGQLLPIHPGTVEGLHLADLDGDGDQDMVLIESGDMGPALALLERTEDGYGEPQRLALHLTGSTVVLAAGDVNGDGKDDLVSVYGGQPQVLAGADGLALSVPPRPDTFKEIEPRSLVLHDADRDGNPDLVGLYEVYAWSEGDPHDAFVGVHLGDGSGGFAGLTRYSLGTTQVVVPAARLADLNGDGNLDVLAAWGPKLHLVPGGSDGTFEPPVTMDVSLTDVVGEQPLVQDVDGDGQMDAALVTRAGLRVALSDGTGNFSVRDVPVNPGWMVAGTVLSGGEGEAGVLFATVALNCGGTCNDSCGACFFEDLCLECLTDADCSEGSCGNSRCRACLSDDECDADSLCLQDRCQSVLSEQGDWTALALSIGGGCGLRGQALSCWGDWSDVPDGDFVQVALARGEGGFGCALDADGEVTCWPGPYGQSPPNTPAGPFERIVGSHEGTVCGLRAGGAVVCWGLEEEQLAKDLPAGQTFVDVGLGLGHGCGLDSDGMAHCWGRNDDGQASPPEGIVFHSLGVGYQFSCGIEQAGGKLRCWGLDNYGQSSPPSGSFSQVQAGTQTACALADDGKLACWGGERFTWQPRGEYTAVSLSGHYACAIRTSGHIECNGTYGP